MRCSAVALLAVMFFAAPVAAQEECLSVPADIVADVESGLTVDGGGELAFARAVRSGAHEKAWFVSADLVGDGLEGGNDVATWIVTGLYSGGGMVLSVDAMAQEFSVYPDAERTAASATMADPGARASQRCVQEADE